MKIGAAAIKQYGRGFLKGVLSLYQSLWSALPYIFNRNPNSLHKEITEQYPDPVSSKTIDDLPARARGLLKNEIEQCIGCHECATVCPTQSIFIESEKIEETQKEWVSIFNIDNARCVFCGLCTEVCPTGSLTHTREYEGAKQTKGDLISMFGKGESTIFRGGP